MRMHMCYMLQGARTILLHGSTDIEVPCTEILFSPPSMARHLSSTASPARRITLSQLLANSRYRPSSFLVLS